MRARDAQSTSERSAVRTVVLIIFLTLGLAILVAAGGFLWLEMYVKTHAPERVVGPQGALFATDASGLGRLNELYALPKSCTESNMRKAPVLEALTLCAVPKPATKIESRPGLVYLMPRTKAAASRRMFALPGGRLVSPYSANTYDMARDGGVEVERIKVQEKNREVEGWVVPGELLLVCCPMP